MGKLTITEIEKKLSSVESEKDAFYQECVKDDRKGVQVLLKRWLNEQQRNEMDKKLYVEMTLFEREWREKGFPIIVGVDEVGRGPLAGPVIAAAVVLPKDFYLPGLNDSKKVSEKKRNEFYKYITENAISIGIGIMDAQEIDEVNIYQATKKAMLQAIQELSIAPDVLLIDAMELDVPYEQQAIIKGDSKSVSIAAASIIAKVTRDRLMKDLANQYPEYGFERNMGYGTAEHLEALLNVGVSPLHRKSFAPVKDLI